MGYPLAPMESFQFIKSAVEPQDFPFSHLPEVALVGRSNAGKSSFLNSLAKRKLAFVSSTPGKTTLVNFFEWNKTGMLVDLPGYGFAKRSKSEVNKWQYMIESYLTERENLQGLVLVMDISRDWTDQELMLFDFAHFHHIPMAVVLTKYDRLGSNESRARFEKLKKTAPTIHCFRVSNKTGDGVEEVENFIKFEWFKKGRRK